MKTPEDSDNPSDAGEKPHRSMSLPSRILDKAAREQLAGPFGKLGRYALRQHWSITAPDGLENELKPSSACAEDTEGRIKKSPAKIRGLFRRLLARLKRPSR